MYKTDLTVFNNSWYKTGAGIAKRILWYYVNLVFFMNPLNPVSSFKVVLLRLFGAKVGKGVIIKPTVNIKYPWRLTIGDNVWIGERVWIDNLDRVTIGANSCLSQGALLLCGNHNYKKSAFDLVIGPITLEAGVWIGAYSVVCASVTCKSHSILSAGSIATKTLESYSIYQGNPAIKIRDRVIEN
jgi:putative colanic acid biosynthesis acetyltransferase WcaF